MDKDFEGSYTRILFIMVLVYLTIYGYLTYLGVSNPALNAIVPAVGFNLSTWTLPYVKYFWVKFQESQYLRQFKSDNVAIQS